jgi:tetratricopeptide (TPR) repeat protein
MGNKEFWNWFDADVRHRLGARALTFARMFEYLDQFDRPVTIVETGCASDRNITIDENWLGDGRSTVLFDNYVKYNKGHVYTVDLNPEATRVCQTLVSSNVTIHTGDSIEYLKSISKSGEVPSIDLLYLDSYDFQVYNFVQSSVHHFNELMAAMPLLTDRTLVVVDDSPIVYEGLTIAPSAEIGGKGQIVAKYAAQVNAELLFSKYQVGWIGMCPTMQKLKLNSRQDETIKTIINRARRHVEGFGINSVDAESAYREILRRTGSPSSGLERVARGEACVFFAQLANLLGKPGTAADWYREALAADPRAVDYRLDMILKSYRKMGNLKAAQEEGIRATKIEPDNPRTWRVLGGIEHELGNISNCIACYDKQLELAPDDPNAMLDRITIALDTADYELPQKLAKKLMDTPRRADAIHCLAVIAYRQSKHEEAIKLYDEALAAGCVDQATIRWNKSLALHAIGKYREGWIEHEYRREEAHQPALAVPFQRFSLPTWSGQEPPARLHVHAEAGAGDNLCMVRYLPILVDRGYEVCYEAVSDMKSLIERNFPQVEVVTRAPDYPGAIGIKPFDYHIPIGSLPNILDTDIDTVPWQGPYLKPDPELVNKYREKLKGERIGICWSSGIRKAVWIAEYGRRKSMPFSKLASLIDGREHLFTSLQVGPERDENENIISDLLPTQPVWDDTAALIANLDLVITVDTAVMHLAGAMGKPTWVMAQKDGASWHLMCERPGASWNRSNPWYPSLYLFRQHKYNEPHFWGEVVDDVRDELIKWLA